MRTNETQANPRLANLRDEDDRLPLHWAVSRNQLNVVELLVQRKDFDVDVKVVAVSGRMTTRAKTAAQDGSGWTPLHIGSNIKDNDELVELLLKQGADVNAKSA